MPIKTSLNLKFSQSALLYEVAEQFNVSLSFVINSLARKIFKSHSFLVRFFESVQYQPTLIDENDWWKCVPVSFESDVYEKCLDMRKMFKLSVSLIFAFGIKKYLDDLITELKGEKEGDNYTANYLFFFTRHGSFCYITLLWETIEPEKLEKINQFHRQM